MVFNRLFMLSLVFSGITLSAQAQYTSKSTTTTETTQKSQKTVATTSTSSATTKTNPYTGNGSATAAQPVKKEQPARPTFRPRPQAASVPQTAGDDELPSFEALENPTGSSKNTTAQGTAQDPNAPPPPPPPPPKGEIWFYTADFAYRDLTGRTMNCTWKVVLQNKTDTEIKRLKIVYTVLGENNPMTFSKVAPNASVVKKHGLFSEKCPAISQSKPKVKVVSCKMGTATGQDCLKYIVVK